MHQKFDRFSIIIVRLMYQVRKHELSYLISKTIRTSTDHISAKISEISRLISTPFKNKSCHNKIRFENHYQQIE